MRPESPYPICEVDSHPADRTGGERTTEGRAHDAPGPSVRRRSTPTQAHRPTKRHTTTLFRPGRRGRGSASGVLVRRRCGFIAGVRSGVLRAVAKISRLALARRGGVCAVAAAFSGAHDTGRAPPVARPAVWRRRDALQAHQTRPRSERRGRRSFHSGRTAERAESGWCPACVDVGLDISQARWCDKSQG